MAAAGLVGLGQPRPSWPGLGAVTSIEGGSGHLPHHRQASWPFSCLSLLFSSTQWDQEQCRPDRTAVCGRSGVPVKLRAQGPPGVTRVCTEAVAAAAGIYADGFLLQA